MLVRTMFDILYIYGRFGVVTPILTVPWYLILWGHS
jgi:hypothetical protein